MRDVMEILEVAEQRRREADWFKSIRVHPTTVAETEVTQATIHVEDRAESELAFGSSATLERQLVQKVVEVGLACDAKSRIVKIAARGGKKVRDKCAASFTFTPKSAWFLCACISASTQSPFGRSSFAAKIHHRTG